MKTVLKNKWIKIGFVFIIAVLAFTLAISFTNKNTKTVDATEPKTLSIAYNNLAFQDNVYIVYAVASENIEDKQNINVLVWENPQEEYIYGAQDYTLSYYRTMDIYGVPHSVFILNSLSAKQMTEEVYAVAYYDGIYSAPNKYSILQYAKNKITSTDNDNLRNLLTNMLAYGASAQIYYNYNTDKLATDTYYSVTVTKGKLSDGFIKGLYKEGTEITVTANAPAAGYTFKQWTDGETVLGTDSTLTYALDKNITLTAEYELTPTADEYFTFTLLSDDTYEIKAKNRNNMPANVVLPSTYNDKAVTSIGNEAFYYCSSLTSIVIPDSVTSIGYYAFYYCSSLTSITIGGSVTSIGNGAFRGCTSLTSITVDENNANYKSIDGNLLSYDGTTLIQYAIGKIATEFTIPDSVTSIGDDAFRDCTSLTSVTIGNSVTSIGNGAFQTCYNLTSVTIPDGVTSIGNYAFQTCYNLTSVTIGNSVTSIGNNAFFYCNKLIEVYNKSSLTITAGNTDYGYVGYYAENIYTPSRGTSKLSTDSDGYIVYTVGADKFLVGYIGNGTELILPNDITVIYYKAFNYCRNLTSITIPDSVTWIGYQAFYSCTSLTNITIGNSVTSIGNNAFYECSSLTSITFDGTQAQWNSISKGSGWNYKSSISVVHCTDGDVAI